MLDEAKRGERDEAHLTWPWNPAVLEEIPTELDGLLQRRQGTGCRLVRYFFEFEKNQWRFDRATKSLDDIKNLVLCLDTPKPQDQTFGAFL